MEKWIQEKFSLVKNHKVIIPDLGDPEPFPSKYLGKIIKKLPI
jgi:hypothetical protein